MKSIKKKLTENDVTAENDFINRRDFIGKSAKLGIGLTLAAGSVNALAASTYDGNLSAETIQTDYGKNLEPHTFKQITNYNNFYEFGTDKGDPSRKAHTLKTKPWHINVSGECAKKGNYDIDDFFSSYQLEERIYRLRCVEGWSMVIPWIGVPLAKIINTFEPNSKAKFVVFKTLLNKEQMPGQSYNIIDWPYIEGLTMAEAMHPLSILSVGLYGKDLLNQNGAPVRLVVPWKYGFKSIKSIVSIHFQEEQPINSWQQTAPNEYGFYANVNPKVDHPRWSQKRERVIGRGGFFSPEKRDTEIFNGYANEVEHLYAGLDLVVNF